MTKPHTKVTSYRLDPYTLNQLDQLATHTGKPKTEVIQLAIDRMHREEIKTMTTQRINLDDNTDVDWQGAGHYAAYIGKERYIWKRDDDPNNEPVYVTNWKQLIGKEYTIPKRW